MLRTNASNSLAIPVGYGRHSWDIRALTLTPDKILLLTTQTVFSANALLWIKISILCFCLHIFKINRRFRLAVYWGIGIISFLYLGLIANTITIVVYCSSWDFGGVHRAFCTNQDIPALIGGAINVVTDIYVLALVITQVLKLQTTRKRKTGILLVFLVGVV